MPDSLPEPPDLDPASLAGGTFSRSRRGLEPIEVNKALGRAADALRTWQLRDRSLVSRIESLEFELTDARKLDEGRIASVLGEETARVISAAREAAEEIRSKAETHAARILKETEETSTASANALKSEAESLRAEAESMREQAAREYSSKLEEAERLHDELVSTGQERHDQLVTSAQERHDQLVTTGQERHDELLGAGQERHDELTDSGSRVLAERTHEAEALFADLVAQGQEAKAKAGEQAEGNLKEAAAEVQRVLDKARADGREMVGEAKSVRDRILSDLAERRRTARRQIEGAMAGRDRILEVMHRAGKDLDTVVSRLETADEQARDAAGRAADSLPDDSGEFLDGLPLREPADSFVPEPFASEQSDDRPAGSDEPVAARSVDREDNEAPPADGPEADETPADPVSEVVDSPRSGSTGIATGAAVVMGSPVAVLEEESSPEDQEEPTDDPEELYATSGADRPDKAHSDEDDTDSVSAVAALLGPQKGATVHDLFARIRAQGLEPDAEIHEDDLDSDDLHSDEEDGESEDSDVSEGGSSTQPIDSGTVPETGAAASSINSNHAGESAGNTGGQRGDAAVVDVDELQPAQSDFSSTGLGELERVSALLDARDELLLPVERQLLRSLRRVASDEQNDVLDRLRRHKRGLPRVDDVIPTTAEMLEVFNIGVADDFSAAVEAGFTFWGRVGGVSASQLFEVPSDLRSRLETILGGFISVHRAHLERAIEVAAESGTDIDGLGNSIKAVYRDWRQSSLAEIASDLAIAGFSHGERSAAGPGTPWIWVVDNGGLPCADGEDNALAGAVHCDEAFPTGDITPPAHAGCRCILVPAHN